MKRYAFLLFLCHGCSDHQATYPYIPMPTPDGSIRDAGKTGSGGATSGSGGATSAGGTTSAEGGHRDAGADSGMKGRACAAEPVMTCPSPKPSFKKDVVPIVNARCLSCHSGADANGPWPLTNLDDIAHWKPLVVQDIENCTMPPVDAGPPLTAEESATFLGWLACDAPYN